MRGASANSAFLYIFEKKYFFFLTTIKKFFLNNNKLNVNFMFQNHQSTPSCKQNK